MNEEKKFNDIETNEIDPNTLINNEDDNNNYTETQTNQAKRAKNNKKILNNYKKASSQNVKYYEENSFENQINNSQDIVFYNQGSTTNSEPQYYDDGNQTNYNDQQYYDNNQVNYDNQQYVDNNQGNYNDQQYYNNNQVNYDNQQYIDNNQGNYNDQQYYDNNQVNYDNQQYVDNNQGSYNDQQYYDNNQVNYDNQQYVDNNQSNYSDQQYYDNNQVNYDNQQPINDVPIPQITVTPVVKTREMNPPGTNSFEKKVRKANTGYNILLFFMYIIIFGTIGYIAYTLIDDGKKFYFEKNDVTILVGSSYEDKVLKKNKVQDADNYTFTSENDAIASVNNKGVITAKSEGKVDINVTSKETNKTFKIKVNVVNMNINELTLKPKDKTVYKGNIYTLTPYVNGQNDVVISYIWSSSDNSIVTVNSEGEIKPQKTGRAYITVSIPNTNFSASSLIIVK